MTKPGVVARESQHTPIRDLGNGAIEYQLAHNARRVMNIGDAEFAEFIVRACNSHQALVEALQAAQLVIELKATHNPQDIIRLLEAAGDYESGHLSREKAIEEREVIAAKLIEQALRLAQGEK